jgi:hypothetical protein
VPADRSGPGSNLGSIIRLGRVLVALLALVLVFAPGPVDRSHDARLLSASVLSPTVEAATAPAAVVTSSVARPLAVLALGLVVLVSSSRRRGVRAPVLRFNASVPRRRPPRRGPPVLSI